MAETNNEREYKDIRTPTGGVVVKLKSWLTAREKRDIRSAFMDGLNLSLDTDEKETKEFAQNYSMKGEVLTALQDKKITNVVVEVDGKTTNVLNALLDMRDEDFNFVMEEVNKVSDDAKEADKKK